MASTTFVSNVTRIVRAWLQDVNDSTYGPTAPVTTLRGQMADPTSVGNGPAIMAYNGALAYGSGSDDTVGGVLYTNLGRTAR